MIQFRLKQFSEFIEKLFASTEDKLLSYSETSCREIIKCMEMWQEDSVMHWINDVALSQYGIIKPFRGASEEPAKGPSAYCVYR